MGFAGNLTPLQPASHEELAKRMGLYEYAVQRRMGHRGALTRGRISDRLHLCSACLLLLGPAQKPLVEEHRLVSLFSYPTNGSVQPLGMVWDVPPVERPEILLVGE